MMDGQLLPALIYLLLTSLLIEAWNSSIDNRRLVEKRNPRGVRSGIHYHSKRHMLAGEADSRKRVTTLKPKEIRKKPSGHLTPLADDDMDNDEVISVAIGPPPTRPKYEKPNRKVSPKPAQNPGDSNVTVATLIKDIFTQLGREFLSRQINEDFVFGQYVGNSMKNLTADQRLSMQHEVLDLIVKYQKLNRGDTTVKTEDKSTVHVLKNMKVEKKLTVNDTEEPWPDFSNLAKIVG